MLTLPIKKKWFDMISSGEKKEEYRSDTHYYHMRLRNLVCASIDPCLYVIRFRNGYSKTSPLMECLVSIGFGKGRTEWGAEKGVEYNIIKIIKVRIIKEY